jgi:protein TonB
MVLDRATGREVWLRLACLAVSVGLHAGLAAMGWQGLGSMAADDGPMIVALVARPSAKLMDSPASAPPALRSRAPSAASARRMTRPPAAVPATTQTAPVARAEPLCAVPEATVIEAPAEAALIAFAPDLAALAGEERGAWMTSGGTGLGSGLAGGTGDGSKPAGAEGGGLIKATPRYESNPLPPYPRLARQNRWEGTVRLRAMVTAGGVVETVALERSSGHAALDRSALDGVQQWRFIPATRGGVPIACEVSIPVAFRLTEP